MRRDFIRNYAIKMSIVATVLLSILILIGNYFNIIR